jgi:hypothetical protein
MKDEDEGKRNKTKGTKNKVDDAPEVKEEGKVLGVEGKQRQTKY